MARVSLTINNGPISPMSFHTKTFGKNIQISNNGSQAARHTSFDHGITFTSKPVKMNERVYMKIVDIDEGGQWLGSLAVGFTQINPDSVKTDELCKSALPNLCQKSGTSYVKRIFDKLFRQIIIAFYYNQEGAFYILDGKENELCKNVDTRNPLWGVIDIYGNVKMIELIAPPEIVAGSREIFNKYNQNPDKLPIRYYPSLKSKPNFQQIGFIETHGPELELFCMNTIVLRKNIHNLSRPYIFMDFPMVPNDELYIRILSIDPNYRTAGVVGFTNAEKTVFTTKFDQLPSNDPTALYDRKEFWIVNDDVFDEKLSELDEYRFVFNQNGEIQMWRNTESNPSTKTIAFADSGQKFYPFFFLNGRINALGLIGIISASQIAPKQNSNSTVNDQSDDSCQICYNASADCVLIPCGHIFFCFKCKDSYEALSKKECPVCRKPYTEAYQIAS